MWLKRLKVAIIERDTDKFELLLKDIPQLSEKKDIEEALYLIESAKEIVEQLKSETKASMKQMKKNLDFLNSTRVNKVARFDITT
jgi:predicted sugar kinase